MDMNGSQNNPLHRNKFYPDGSNRHNSIQDTQFPQGIDNLFFYGFNIDMQVSESSGRLSPVEDAGGGHLF